MSLQTQVPADFLFFEGRQTATFRSRYGEDGSFIHLDTGFDAIPTRGETESETDIGNVAAGRRAQVWWFRADAVNGQFGSIDGNSNSLRVVNYVKPRDRIIGVDGSVWEVWRVENRCLNSMYRVTCFEVVHP